MKCNRRSVVASSPPRVVSHDVCVCDYEMSVLSLYFTEGKSSSVEVHPDHI